MLIVLPGEQNRSFPLPVWQEKAESYRQTLQTPPLASFGATVLFKRFTPSSQEKQPGVAGGSAAGQANVAAAPVTVSFHKAHAINSQNKRREREENKQQEEQIPHLGFVCPEVEEKVDDELHETLLQHCKEKERRGEGRAGEALLRVRFSLLEELVTPSWRGKGPLHRAALGHGVTRVTLQLLEWLLGWQSLWAHQRHAGDTTGPQPPWEWFESREPLHRCHLCGTQSLEREGPGQRKAFLNTCPAMLVWEEIPGKSLFL